MAQLHWAGDGMHALLHEGMSAHCRTNVPHRAAL